MANCGGVTSNAGSAGRGGSGTDGTVTSTVATRADYGAVEGLLTRVSTATMTGITETGAADLAKYGLDRPQTTVLVKTGSSTARLDLGKEEDGKVYAKDGARDLIFTVDASLANDVRRTPADFRDKDLFEFRPYTAKKLVITRGTDTITLEKTKGTGENAAEAWQRAGGSAPLDQPKVEDFLSQLSGLKAASWEPRAPSGSAALQVVVTYDDKALTEQVILSRAGSDVFASRSGEPGVAKVETAGLDGVLKALDDALAPPAPATPPAGSDPATKP